MGCYRLLVTDDWEGRKQKMTASHLRLPKDRAHGQTPSFSAARSLGLLKQVPASFTLALSKSAQYSLQLQQLPSFLTIVEYFPFLGSYECIRTPSNYSLIWLKLEYLQDVCTVSTGIRKERKKIPGKGKQNPG